MMSDHSLHLAERADRANAAASALKHLDAAFDEVIATYMKRMTVIASTEPWEGRKITNLAVAAKIAEEVRSSIRAIASDGPAAHDEIRRLRKIEGMSPERRRVLGLTIPGMV
jgi:uncharacterized membrane protein